MGRTYKTIKIVRLPYFGLLGWVRQNVKTGRYFFTNRQSYIICRGTYEEVIEQLQKDFPQVMLEDPQG